MMRLIGWIFRGIGFVIPWLVRAAWAAIQVMVLSLVSIWRGIPSAVDEIADDMIGDASVAGTPTEYDRWLEIGAQAVAFITIVIGWVLWAFLTVFVLGLIF